MPEPLRKVVPSERGEAQETTRNPQIAPVPPVERGEAAETARAPQIAPVEERSRKAAAAPKALRVRRRDRVRWVLFALLPLALIVAGYLYVTGGRMMFRL